MERFAKHPDFTASNRSVPGLGAKFRKWLAHPQIDELKTLPERYRHDLGIETHDIADTVDREIGKLGADEFRSRG